MVIVKTEESLRAVKELTRNVASCEQNETMLLGRALATQVPERKGKHYRGTNRGTALQDVVPIQVNEAWMATVLMNKQIYGTKYRIPTEKQLSDEPEKVECRRDKDLEWVFWHSMHWIVF